MVGPVHVDSARLEPPSFLAVLKSGSTSQKPAMSPEVPFSCLAPTSGTVICSRTSFLPVEIFQGGEKPTLSREVKPLIVCPFSHWAHLWYESAEQTEVCSPCLLLGASLAEEGMYPYFLGCYLRSRETAGAPLLDAFETRHACAFPRYLETKCESHDEGIARLVC